MKIAITSRHYELTPALREYAESKIENLTTYFDGIVSAHIIFAVEKYRHLVEVTLRANGKDIVAHDESEDMYASIDRVTEKLERQIEKHKGKLYNNRKSKGHTAKIADVSALPPESAEDEESGSDDEVLPADPIEFPKLSVTEAVVKLRENGQGFSIFSNRVTNRLNVLYKREDGSIGIIEA